MTEWIVSASLLIAVVLALRAALGKRIGAGLRYGLWAVVLVRLLVPVSLLAVTVPRLPAWTPPEAMREETIYVLPVDNRPVAESGVHVFEDGTLGDPGSFGYPRLTDGGERVVRYADRISPLELLGWVWIGGAAVMGAVLIAANVRFARRLRRTRKPLEGTNAPVPVYVAAGLPSPCLMGVLKPAVYVTEEAAADPAMLRHVLAHELTHYGHLDHVWSVLRGAALAVHWWNPLVWLAVVCSRRDGELACDEGALRRLGDGERAAYGETLLALVTAKSGPGDLLCFATTMSGGKRSLKERVQRIAKQPKTLVSAMVVVVAVALLSSVVAFGQAAEAPGEQEPASPAEEWQDGQAQAAIPQADLDHDGIPDTLTLRRTEDSGLTVWKLEFTASGMSAPTWEGEAAAHHIGWTSFFLCRMDGEDYLLQYTPYMSTGLGDYNYKLFYLTADGEEVVVQENSVGFDVNFDLDGHEFCPETISAFMEEINALLAQSELLVNTDGDLISTFQKEGRLYDSIWWLEDIRDDSLGLTLLDELRNYEKLAKGYPDSSAAFPEMDLDHDGRADTLDLRSGPDPLGYSYDGTVWILQCSLSGGGVWEIEGRPSLPGENAVFLCRMDGEDYLLVYTPEFWHGQGYYEYRLIWLDGGREVVVQENSVAFDTRFRGGPDDIGFDPEAIAAFMDEVNALLAGSVQLVNTNIYLQQVFASHGRLYDDLYWLDGKWREDGLTLREILRNYGSYFGDHPDDAWSPLADLLLDLTEEDFPAFNGDTAGLVRLLRSAERGSRFYSAYSARDAYVGNGGEEADYTLWDLSLADGSALWLLACEERPSVLVIYETPEEAVSAFYTAPELKEWILRGEASPQTRQRTAPEENEPVQSEKASLDSQAEQYYEAGSLPLFQIAFSRLDKEAQGRWLEKIYADGAIAFFSTVADYMDEAELELWLERALEDANWTFQSVLFNKLDRNDEFDSLKEENEKKWAEAQMAEYQAVGVTWEGKSCYYQEQLVNIFLDVRANQSFYTLDINPAGTVNIKIVRNEKNEITGVDYMTDAEAEELLRDRE